MPVTESRNRHNRVYGSISLRFLQFLLLSKANFFPIVPLCPQIDTLARYRGGGSCYIVPKYPQELGTTELGHNHGHEPSTAQEVSLWCMEERKGKQRKPAVAYVFRP